PDADEVVLARRVSAEGRTRAYLGGRSATAADLRDVGGALLSFYGQHEHRKLTLASAQLDILDGFCGPEQAARRGACAAAHAEVVDAPAGRLDEVEDRLAQFERLKRKHGGTIAAVLEHASECARRRAELEGAEEALERGEGRLAEARAVLAERAAALHDAREGAAGRLADAVRERLAELAMEGASFAVALSTREAPGPTGAG